VSKKLIKNSQPWEKISENRIFWLTLYSAAESTSYLLTYALHLHPILRMVYVKRRG